MADVLVEALVCVWVFALADVLVEALVCAWVFALACAVIGAIYGHLLLSVPPKVGSRLVAGRGRQGKRRSTQKNDRRIARAEPCFVEVVRLGRQRRFCLDERLGNFVGRRLAARDVAVHGVDELGDARVALVRSPLPIEN